MAWGRMYGLAGRATYSRVEKAKKGDVSRPTVASTAAAIRAANPKCVKKRMLGTLKPCRGVALNED